MIGALIDGAIKRRKVILAFTAVMAIFGVFAYVTLPREAQPDIAIPFVTVVVPYPGVSPEDAERLLVRPMERELKTIPGLKEMNASARQGLGLVNLEFEVNFDKNKVLEDVRAKVDLARSKFPPDALPPQIEEANIAQNPVLGVVLSGAAPERTLFALTQSLQERLTALPGVLTADMSGAREEVMEVTIDPLRMEAYNVTTGDLAGVIARNNQLIPAGSVRTHQGSFAVKLPGVIEKPEDILRLPIKKAGDRIVTIGDIGNVRRTFKEATSISRYNGQPSFGLYVVKRPGSNLLETVASVKKAVAAEQKAWPANLPVRVDYSFDDSEFIGHTLSMLESGLITATLLVMLIIISALGVRQGVMVGLAIPTCFMIGFLMLQQFHITLNQMVMFGLVLAVGILVDGGIVIVEYADRKMAEGLEKKEAFAAAAKRMFWPVVNGVLTTLCAFLPFLFWNSIAGKFMSFLPLTLFFVLGASIFVALIFTPALGSIMGRKQGVDLEHLAEIEKSEHGDPREMKGFMGWYARVISGAGKRPFMVTGAALVVVAAVIIGFAIQKHRTEFFIDQDPDNVTVFVKARGNLSVDAKDALVKEIEAKLTGIKGVEAIDTRVGAGFWGGRNGPPNDAIGQVNLEFVDFDAERELNITGRDIVEVVRKRLSQETPGVLTELRLPQGGPPVGKDIQVELRSENSVELNRAANLVRAHLATDPQIIELEDTRTSPGIEWNFAVDRVAAGRYGVDVLSVGQAIQFVTDGILVGKFRPDDAQDELDIRVRFPPDARNIAAFDQLKITTPLGPVPASYFVKMAPAQQVTSINRRDGQRLVVVQANVRGMAPNQKIAELKPWLAKASIDSSVRWKFTGADEEGQKAGLFFAVAMAVTLFLMFMILLWQFNSFYGVVVTLSAVVLSTVGVLLGVDLNLFHTFDYVSVIMLGTGIVALAGVVVGHNIVLVDTFYQLRRSGYEADDAAVRAATQRFRPVMLTTVVTVIGLLPMMFQLHPDFRNGGIDYRAPGSEWWVQLSATVVWGLTFSTLLTLFLTPAALAAPKSLHNSFDRLIRLVMRLFGHPEWGRRFGGPREAAAPRPYPEAAE